MTGLTRLFYSNGTFEHVASVSQEGTSQTAQPCCQAHSKFSSNLATAESRGEAVHRYYSYVEWQQGC